jgi:type II secretory ATPase GspE/PulE/Tfp pilus assembly ATPase PilB-like protein
MPTLLGEKLVVRILDKQNLQVRLEELGFRLESLGAFKRMLAQPHGIVFVTGPTGSGKTTTLYSALDLIRSPESNIVTVEDPVEYQLDLVNQVQTHESIGLTFARALRSILRQDPDVIMIGEIRDRETAEIAMAAAVTGHLVLSTLHTWDAPGAIARLLDMGVPPFLVASGLAGVVAQRLLRTVCSSCLGRTDEGCEACVSGYRGRTGVFQILVMTDALRDAVARGAGATELRRRANEGGMRSLADAARRKVAEGLTTPHEAARVVNGDAASASPCEACGRNGPADAPGCVHCGRPRRLACPCGRSVQRSWRYCPECLHPIIRVA